jgi:hypothetical protein
MIGQVGLGESGRVSPDTADQVFPLGDDSPFL